MHTDYKRVEINSDELIELKAIEHDLKSRFVLFQFISNNVPINLSDCNVRVYAINSKRNKVFNNLTLVDPLIGKARLELTDAFLKWGKTIYQLKIYSTNGERLSSNIFSLEVGQDLIDGNYIESTNEFTALEDALKAVDNIDVNFRKINNKINHKLDKDGIVTMTNMGQDVKEAMTGGSVAVVGKDAVDSPNIRNGAITLTKINKDTKEYIDGKLEKLKLENLISNPIFDSIDNWILTSARAGVESNICKLTATSQWGNIKSNISSNFSEGDLVYISTTTKTSTPSIKLEFGEYIESGYPAIALEIPPSEEYIDISGVIEINSRFANKDLSCCIVDHNTSNWQPVYIKGITVINLTKEFNGITENINKETIDSIIKNNTGGLFFKNTIYLNSINTDITPSLKNSIIENRHLKEKAITLEKLNDDVISLINTSVKGDQNNLKVLAENNNYVRIISGYSKKDNLSIFLQRTGSNHIFNIKKISLLDKVSYAETVLCQMGTDWLGPYEVAAKNNIDGDQPHSHYMTGGNHAYNDQESYTESDTGRTLEVKIFIDNELLEGTFDGECKKVKIIFTNRVQAFNTTKHDGSGREVLEENYTITCVNSGELKIENMIKALEPIEILKYYGLQALNEPWNSELFYYSDVNKKINSPLIQTNSGGTECEKIVLRKNNNKLTMKIDRTTGLGRLKKINPAAFSQSFGKTYFNLINSNCTQSLDTGEIITWEGSYIFENE